MAVSAQTMGAAALFVLLLLGMFYLGNLMGRVFPLLLRAVSCAALAVAAVLYAGSGGWHDPKDYLIRLAVFLAVHLCVCRITDFMFLHRQMIGNYGVLLSSLFMIMMMPAFFGTAVSVRFLVLALLVMAGFLFMVRQVRRKKSFDWILALAAAGAAGLFCRKLLPALMTVCIIYIFELLRRPSPKIAAAAACSAAVLAAEAVLFLTGHVPQAVLAQTPDPAALPMLQEVVLSESFLMVLGIVLFAGTVLCPFIRYFVMNRRIGTTELYPLIYAVIGMVIYTFGRKGEGADGIDLRAALYLCSLVPLSAAAFGALYERCADDFDLGRIFAGDGRAEDAEEESEDAESSHGRPEDDSIGSVMAADTPQDSKPLSKEDEKRIDSLFRGSQESKPSSDTGIFEFIDPDEKEI